MEEFYSVLKMFKILYLTKKYRVYSGHTIRTFNLDGTYI